MTLSQFVPWVRARDVPIRQRPSDNGGGYHSPLALLQEDMNGLFEDFFSGALMPDMQQLQKMPAIDLVENDKDFRLRVELAGMEPEDITVEMTEDVLTLSGERRNESEDRDEEDGYLRREISYGRFKRSIPLPQSADSEAASASFKNGILTIEVPKKAEAVQQPRKLDIQKTA